MKAMNKEPKEKVFYDSPEAATYKTNIEGWVSRDGRFWGKDEHMARYNGSTHKLCECGQETEKHYLLCLGCRNAKSNERYESMPFKEWDKETPLVLFHEDTYFFSEEDLLEYWADNDEVALSELQLVICEPNHLREVSLDYWDDALPEDWEWNDMDPQLAEMVKNLNRYIATLPPVSWQGGKFRTSYSLES